MTKDAVDKWYQQLPMDGPQLLSVRRTLPDHLVCPARHKEDRQSGRWLQVTQSSAGRFVIARPDNYQRLPGCQFFFACLVCNAGVTSELNSRWIGSIPPSGIVIGCLTSRGLVQRPGLAWGELFQSGMLHKLVWCPSWIVTGCLTGRWLVHRHGRGWIISEAEH